MAKEAKKLKKVQTAMSRGILAVSFRSISKAQESTQNSAPFQNQPLPAQVSTTESHPLYDQLNSGNRFNQTNGDPFLGNDAGDSVANLRGKGLYSPENTPELASTQESEARNSLDSLEQPPEQTQQQDEEPSLASTPTSNHEPTSPLRPNAHPRYTPRFSNDPNEAFVTPQADSSPISIPPPTRRSDNRGLASELHGNSTSPDIQRKPVAAELDTSPPTSNNFGGNSSSGFNRNSSQQPPHNNLLRDTERYLEQDPQMRSLTYGMPWTSRQGPASYTSPTPDALVAGNVTVMRAKGPDVPAKVPINGLPVSSQTHGERSHNLLQDSSQRPSYRGQSQPEGHQGNRADRSFYDDSPDASGQRQETSTHQPPFRRQTALGNEGSGATDQFRAAPPVQPHRQMPTTLRQNGAFNGPAQHGSQEPFENAENHDDFDLDTAQFLALISPPIAPKKGFKRLLPGSNGDSDTSGQTYVHHSQLTKPDYNLLCNFERLFELPKAKNSDQLVGFLRAVHLKLEEMETQIHALESNDTKQRDTIASHKQKIQSLQDEDRQTKETLQRVRGERDLALTQKANLKTQLENKEFELRHSHDQKLKAAKTESDAKISGLEMKLSAAKQKAADEYRWLQNEKSTMERSYEAQINHLQNQHLNDLTARDQSHAMTVNHLNHNHDLALRDMDAGFQMDKARMQAQIDDMGAGFQMDKARMQAQIGDLWNTMANYSRTADYTAITDEDFKDRLDGLSRRLNNLMSFMPSLQNAFVDSSLDPSNYLARNSKHGGRIYPKFVSYLCWGVVLQSFFTRQPGFGALGGYGTPGWELLDQVYQLFAAASSKDENSQNSAFPNTNNLNAWRARFFAAILQGVLNGQASNSYVQLFHSNVSAVADRLFSTLLRLSGNRLSPDARAEIGSIMEATGILALEMGAQRAHLFLEACEHGQKVMADDQFKDDARYGAEQLVVDIMTQPCMRRMGDGEDLSVRRVISIGDVESLG